MAKLIDEPEGYDDLLNGLEERIRAARVQAALAVNRELVLLYWRIGRDILERIEQAGWGAGFLERLSRDLRRAFPDVRGFSLSNLKYMRQLAAAWSESEISQQAVGQIPWGHNLTLIEKLKSKEERLWYARASIEHGWSRAVLVHQIESGLYHRKGKALTNFERALPAPQSELTRDLVKDPYKLEFLGLGDEAKERQLHRGLLRHLQAFILELGQGFAFVGSEYPLRVGESDFHVDLLFYHLRLRCYVVIELKTVEFKPEYAGKLSFYLTAVDEELRHPDDQPSIGILLCKGKDRLVAEYALRGLVRPMGVSEYELTESLPEELRGQLPSIEELQAELESEARPSLSSETGR